MKNIHIFMTPFTHESRLLKEANSLIEAGIVSEVYVAAIWRKGLAEKEEFSKGIHVWRVKLLTRKLPFLNILKYLEWLIQVFFSAFVQDASVIHSHSLAALPIGVILKLTRGNKLIYDAHELETEANGREGISKTVWKIIESFLIPYVDHTIVVSDAIADWYVDHYSIKRPSVIRNIPNNILPINHQSSSSKTRDKNLKDIFNIQEKNILFIYVGGLFRGRGIEIILQSFTKVYSDKHIVFMGYGELETLIEEHAKKHHNIHYKSAVTPDQVLSYTQTADIGISLIENICLSYYYCLPNKVFEYLLSGLPIIVSNFPEMSNIINNYNCGWKIPVEIDSLIGLVNSIQYSDLPQYKKDVKSIQGKIGWHNEAEILLDIYKTLCISEFA